MAFSYDLLLEKSNLLVFDVGDFSEAMIDLCRSRFPNNKWFTADMRNLSLNNQYDCVIAWHSFFHIPKEQQKDVLANLCSLVKYDGLLYFTSGIENGEVWSNNGGEMLYHASLASREYKTILSNNNMKVIAHNVSDPDCGNATVWVAQKVTDLEASTIYT
jgi:trans-aconitate methyltransferase